MRGPTRRIFTNRPDFHRGFRLTPLPLASSGTRKILHGRIVIVNPTSTPDVPKDTHLLNVSASGAFGMSECYADRFAMRNYNFTERNS